MPASVTWVRRAGDAADARHQHFAVDVLVVELVHLADFQADPCLQDRQQVFVRGLAALP